MTEIRQGASGVETLSRSNYRRERRGACPSRPTPLPAVASVASTAFCSHAGAHRFSAAAMLGCCIAVPLALVAVFSLVQPDLAFPGAELSMAGGGGQAASWAPSAASSDSTPRDLWRKGEVPYLYQTDPQWASAPYAGSTVEEAGCGPTCLTMAYIAATGNRDYDPAKLAQFSEQNGFVEEGLTTWTLMTDGAQRLGLNSQELPADARQVASAVGEGHPVILTVGPGDFTSTGHFVVVAGVADDGNWIIRDPNSPQRSQQTWDPQQVLSQCRNLWEISPRGWF